MLAPRCCEHGANKGFKAKRFKYHAICIFNSKTCTYGTNKRCELQIKLKDSRPNRFKCHANCMFKFQNPVIYIYIYWLIDWLIDCTNKRFQLHKMLKVQILKFFFPQCLPSSNYSNSKFCSQVVDSYDVVEAWMFDDFLSESLPPEISVRLWSILLRSGQLIPRSSKRRWENAQQFHAFDMQRWTKKLDPVYNRKKALMFIPVSSIGFRAIYAAERISWRKSRSRRARLEES